MNKFKNSTYIIKMTCNVNFIIGKYLIDGCSYRTQLLKECYLAKSDNVNMKYNLSIYYEIPRREDYKQQNFIEVIQTICDAIQKLDRVHAITIKEYMDTYLNMRYMLPYTVTTNETKVLRFQRNPTIK